MKVISIPRELFIELVTRQLYFPLFLLTLVHAVVWFINLQLGLQILGKKIGLSKMWYGILAGSLFTISGKQLLSDMVYGLVLLGLMVVILKIISKTTWLRAFWSNVVVFLTSILGVLLIIEPLCTASKDITFFILHNPLGAAIGSLIEVIFPALTLFILKIFKISFPIPTGKRITFLDILSIVIFGDVFYMLYSAFARTLIDLKSTSKFALTSDIVSQWASALFGGVAFYVFLAYIRNDQSKREEEKAELLNRIESLFTTNIDLIADDIFNRLQNTKEAKSNTLPENAEPTQNSNQIDQSVENDQKENVLYLLTGKR